MIPKIIHYCWLSDDPIPLELRKYMDSWKRNLPDYEIIKWDFTRFDKQSSFWVREAFDKKKYAFAADYIRLYALFTMGGIYLDSDVEVLKSFNPFLQSDHMIGWEVNNYAFQAAIIGAEKKAEWVKVCLDYYENRHFIRPDGSLDIKTLPTILYDVLKEKGYQIQTVDNNQQLTNNTLYIYPEDFFSPKSYTDLKIYKTKNTVAIHHFAGSWLPKDVKEKHAKQAFWRRHPYLHKLYRWCYLKPRHFAGNMYHAIIK